MKNDTEEETDCAPEIRSWWASPCSSDGKRPREFVDQHVCLVCHITSFSTSVHTQHRPVKGFCVSRYDTTVVTDDARELFVTRRNIMTVYVRCQHVDTLRKSPCPFKIQIDLCAIREPQRGHKYCTVIPSSLEPYLGIVLVVSIAAAVVIVAPNCALDPREEKSLVRDNDGIFPCRGWGGNQG